MEKKTIDEMLEGMDRGDGLYRKHAVKKMLSEYGEQCRKEGFIKGRDLAIAAALSFVVGLGTSEAQIKKFLEFKTAKELQP